MYTNPFDRKHSTIRQVLDRFFDPSFVGVGSGKKSSIRRSESVSSSDSSSSKGSMNSRGILQWNRKR